MVVEIGGAIEAIMKTHFQYAHTHTQSQVPMRQLIPRRSERDLKSPPPLQPELRGKWGSREEPVTRRQASNNGDQQYRQAKEGKSKERRHSVEGEEDVDKPSRRSGRHSDGDTVDNEKGRKKGNSRSRNEESSTKQKLSKKTSKSQPSDEEEEEDAGRERSSKKSNKKHGKKKPTNIDDFDEEELSDSKSESESGSNSGSGSEAEDKPKRKPKSAVIAEMTNARWALGEDSSEREELEKRIEDHQKEIKKQMATLQALQAAQDKKTLPPQQQKMLQQDLEGLKQIYTKLEESPGNMELQMQLLGLQMVLCDHLKKFQDDLKPPPPQGPHGNNQAPYQPYLAQQGSYPSQYPPQQQNGGQYPPQHQNGGPYQHQLGGIYSPQSSSYMNSHQNENLYSTTYESGESPYQSPRIQNGDPFSGAYLPQTYPSPYSGVHHRGRYPAHPNHVEPYVPHVAYPPQHLQAVPGQLMSPAAVPGHAISPASLNSPLLEVQMLVEKQKQLLEERKKLEEEQRKEEEERKKEEAEQHQRLLEEQQRILEEQKQMMEEQKRKIVEQQAIEEQKQAMEEQKKKLLQEQQIIEEQKRKIQLEQQQRSMMDIMAEQHQRAMVEQQRRAVEEQKVLLEQQLEQQRIEKQQRLEKQRMEQQRLEQMRIEQQHRLEQQRLEHHRLEQQRLEQQRIEQQRLREMELQAQLSALRSPAQIPGIMSPLHPVAPGLSPIHATGMHSMYNAPGLF